VGLGVMTGSVFGALMHWRAVATIFGVLCVVGFAAPFLVPATPMWLRSKGREEDADRAERWFGFALPRADQLPPALPPPPCAAAAIATLHRADSTVGAATGPPNASCWAAYATPTVWKPALAALAFFCCQQASGFYLLLFYSVDVLRDFRVAIDGRTAAVYLSVARLVGTVASLLFQSAPKRALTAFSGLGMCVSLTVVVGYAHVYGGDASPPVDRMLVLVAFLLYVFFAMFAVLPLPWSVCGEMFPMSVKGTMNGVLYSCGYELMFVALKMYPPLVAAYGVRAVWSACAVACFVTAAFGAFVLPETTGKTLNEITDAFRARQSASKLPIPP